MAIVDRERLIKQLYGYNPWWAGKQSEVPTFQRTAFFRALSLLLDVNNRRAVMLSGPRRVGKSVVLAQIAKKLIETGKSPRSVMYVSLDDNLLKLSTIPELLDIYREEVQPASTTSYLLLDEVHYSKGWEQEIKTLVDHHPDVRIVATGSASMESGSEGIHGGVGRWTTIPIPTLSFFEFAQIRKGVVPETHDLPMVLSLRRATKDRLQVLRSQLAPLASLFRHYLVVGGFPETAQRQDIAACQKLLREDIVDRVLKRDIVALFNVRNVDDVERLFLYICLHSGGCLNVDECSKQLGVSRQSVLQYLTVLERSHLLFRLGADSTGGKKLLKQQYKYYLVDAALRNAVLLTGEEVLSDPTETGQIVETAVLRHMIAGFYREQPRFSYWQERKSQLEVDIVYRDATNLVPIEVKYRDNAGIGKATGLKRFCELEPTAQPVLITRNEEDLSVDQIPDLPQSVLRIPAHMFCYLIGNSERVNASK